MIIAENAVEAKKFVMEALSRNTNDSFYENYAKTSLLICENNYEKALQGSMNLHDKLVNSTLNDHQTLFAFNLLRIALLYQKMGLKKEELETWETLKKYSNDNVNTFSNAFHPLFDVFQDKQVSLSDYIRHREKLLKNN